jgi:hypothetical protein
MHPTPRSLLLSALLATATLGLPAHAAGVSGQAYGAFVDTLLGPDLAKSPLAVLDPATGLNTAELAGINLVGVASTGTLDSAASGVVGENASTSQSRSTVQAVNLLGGLIRADLIMAMANSAANGSQAVSQANGSTLVGLLVAGTPVAGNVAPNTRISLPGVGYVTIFEQIPSGDGVTNTGMTVNMLHVVLTNFLGIKTGEIIIGSAKSQASFLPGDATPN